jgi:hypothetical protein
MAKAAIIGIAVVLVGATAGVLGVKLPGLEERFGPQGWLIGESSPQSVLHRTYLLTRQRLVGVDGMYFVGDTRIDRDRDVPIRARYEARCYVWPGLGSLIPVGTRDLAHGPNGGYRPFNDKEYFRVDAGYMEIWWALCRGEARSF